LATDENPLDAGLALYSADPVDHRVADIEKPIIAIGFEPMKGGPGSKEELPIILIVTGKQEGSVIFSARFLTDEIGFIWALFDNHEAIPTARRINAEEERMGYWGASSIAKEFPAQPNCPLSSRDTVRGIPSGQGFGVRHSCNNTGS